MAKGIQYITSLSDDLCAAPIRFCMVLSKSVIRLLICNGSFLVYCGHRNSRWISMELYYCISYLHRCRAIEIRTHARGVRNSRWPMVACPQARTTAWRRRRCCPSGPACTLARAAASPTGRTPTGRCWPSRSTSAWWYSSRPPAPTGTPTWTSGSSASATWPAASSSCSCTSPSRRAAGSVVSYSFHERHTHAHTQVLKSWVWCEKNSW